MRIYCKEKGDKDNNEDGKESGVINDDGDDDVHDC